MNTVGVQNFLMPGNFCDYSLSHFSSESSCMAKINVDIFFLRFCRTWTKRYLITLQTRVKRVSRTHHRTILPPARWLGTAWFKSDKISKKKRLLGLAARHRLCLSLPLSFSFLSYFLSFSKQRLMLKWQKLGPPFRKNAQCEMMCRNCDDSTLHVQGCVDTTPTFFFHALQQSLDTPIWRPLKKRKYSATDNQPSVCVVLACMLNYTLNQNVLVLGTCSALLESRCSHFHQNFVGGLVTCC